MGEFPLAQRVRYLVVSLQRPKSMLWRRFNPWPENFYMPRAQPKKQTKVQLLLVKGYWSKVQCLVITLYFSYNFSPGKSTAA